MLEAPLPQGRGGRPGQGGRFITESGSQAEGGRGAPCWPRCHDGLPAWSHRSSPSPPGCGGGFLSAPRLWAEAPFLWQSTGAWWEDTMNSLQVTARPTAVLLRAALGSASTEKPEEGRLGEGAGSLLGAPVLDDTYEKIPAPGSFPSRFRLGEQPENSLCGAGAPHTALGNGSPASPGLSSPPASGSLPFERGAPRGRMCAEKGEFFQPGVAGGVQTRRPFLLSSPHGALLSVCCPVLPPSVHKP